MQLRRRHLVDARREATSERQGASKTHDKITCPLLRGMLHSTNNASNCTLHADGATNVQQCGMMEQEVVMKESKGRDKASALAVDYQTSSLHNARAHV